MGSLRRSFSTDEKKNEDGTWIDIIVNDDESVCRMRVRRMGESNKDFMSGNVAIQKKMRRGGARSSKAVQQLEIRLLRELVVDTVLVDWENVENIIDDSSPYMPFTRANAIALFEELPELLDTITSEAVNRENFLKEQAEETAKN